MVDFVALLQKSLGEKGGKTGKTAPRQTAKATAGKAPAKKAAKPRKSA